ncbi:hypothetical protein C1637_14360 [Chryseobacterium lactis]|uniref:Lipoprotein n=1 Tax=Chryseobacterium lactis TaxID=1241981 RepID=A0A3G6RRI3_CHRLC|nr:hypothetical protein [Chryseobacterium lactis]AZA83695.1 hypothetical protein EG342_18205 [Chryseobacterium lactis]AZB04080.1 hypothetical protein EG341_09080 [Chryseobacterium lactis]PNW13012.1 hypothetical protein C1637_14360 [Chryseobacterium lactis]
MVQLFPISRHSEKNLIVNTILVASLLFFLFSCKKPDAPKQAEEKKDSLCWNDFRYGELPPERAYHGIDSLVKKWNLCYHRIEAGCVITDSIEKLKKQYESSNAIYFKSMEKTLGKDWKQRFDQQLAIADSINWIKIKEEIDRQNQ